MAHDIRVKIDADATSYDRAIERAQAATAARCLWLRCASDEIARQASVAPDFLTQAPRGPEARDR
jgi:hypothetical protein